MERPGVGAGCACLGDARHDAGVIDDPVAAHAGADDWARASGCESNTAQITIAVRREVMESPGRSGFERGNRILA